ncbi:MAG: hypothetical protein E7052_00075 [Lentisphaerae bacterium]|nr:hypothetical protein [Lentisphaerota bacterium]
MKISWFKRAITPEIGTRVSGYGMEDVTFSKWSELFMTGLLADDGKNKVLLISFDLQCMDIEYIYSFRKLCAGILNMPSDAVMLTFTHTHGGPQTNCEAGFADHLNIPYMEMLEKALQEECSKLAAAPQAVECNTFFYSIEADENKNRRVVTPDNYAAFLPHNAELRKLANGYTDKELGSVIFIPAVKGQERFPIYIIGNYAAHPLAAHPLGTGARRISADYPHPFREYIMEETGSEAMFVSGACGDMIPQKDELGSDGAIAMGRSLAEGIFRSLLDATRNPERFCMKSPRVGALCRSVEVPLRSMYRNNPAILPDRDLGKDTITLEIQCLAIGDVCFVGVPGEWCAELGAEVKWHGAFRKNFIAFGATGYQDYMCPGNFLLQGGYEAQKQHFPPRYSIAMVKTAVDATYDLFDELAAEQPGQEYDCPTATNQFKIRPEPISASTPYPFNKQ